MTISRYLQYWPTLGARTFIADGAKIIGRVDLGDHANIWYNCVVRADVNFISIGKNTNVQDLCMLHVTELNSLTIGENTSLGHSVVMHGCKVGNGCLIGMGAIILDGAEIGDECLVAAGSLIPPGKKFPAGSMIKGRPAVIERELSTDERKKIANHYVAYLGYKEQYLKMEEEDGTHQKKTNSPHEGSDR
jgi:gamma-carbonic anhydrase